MGDNVMRFVYPLVGVHLIITFQCVAFCETLQADRQVDSLVVKPDSASKSWPDFRDFGSWLSFRVGEQTKGGPLSDRWSFAFCYEYRTQGLLSFPIDLQVYRIGERSSSRNLLFLQVSLKVRARVFKKFNLSVQAGTGLSQFAPAPFFQYGFGIELLLTERTGVSIGLNQVDLLGEPYVMVGISLGL